VGGPKQTAEVDHFRMPKSMSRVGLSETVIVAKINASQADFDLGIEALSLLKQNGVSDAVVAAMLQRASH
jgi:hypothetical protein